MLVNVPFNGKDQWWWLSIDVEQYITTHQCMSPTKLDSYKFFNKLEMIDKVSNHADIYAEPIIDKDANVFDLRNFRGHEGDPDPFVFRKKTIPLIKAKVFSYFDGKCGVIFHSYYMSNGPLTDGQRSFLNQNFEEALIVFHTKDVIDSLKLSAKQNIVQRMETNLKELTEQIAVFQNEILSYKAKMK